MSKICRECKAPTGWNATECLRCGKKDPLGRNLGDLVLMSIFGMCCVGLIYVAWLLINVAIMH